MTGFAANPHDAGAAHMLDAHGEGLHDRPSLVVVHDNRRPFNAGTCTASDRASAAAGVHGPGDSRGARDLHLVPSTGRGRYAVGVSARRFTPRIKPISM